MIDEHAAKKAEFIADAKKVLADWKRYLGGNPSKEIKRQVLLNAALHEGYDKDIMQVIYD